jgi:hypothetical protein
VCKRNVPPPSAGCISALFPPEKSRHGVHRGSRVSTPVFISIERHIISQIRLDKPQHDFSHGLCLVKSVRAECRASPGAGLAFVVAVLPRGPRPFASWPRATSRGRRGLEGPQVRCGISRPETWRRPSELIRSVFEIPQTRKVPRQKSAGRVQLGVAGDTSPTGSAERPKANL